MIAELQNARAHWAQYAGHVVECGGVPPLWIQCPELRNTQDSQIIGSRPFRGLPPASVSADNALLGVAAFPLT